MPAEPTPAPRDPRKAVPRNRLGRATLVAFAALFSLALGSVALEAPAASAADARYEGISADGSVAFFSTADQLVPGDTDTRRDVYERSFDEAVGGYVTRQVSFGPTGGNNAYDAQYLAAGEAGARVFFSTQERLTAADTDNATDIYLRDLSSNTTTLVSTGDPECEGSCGNGLADASFARASADGNSVFFVSDESLSPEDTDGQPDVYARNLETGRTTLVSTGDPSCPGSCGNGEDPAFFKGASTDGSTAVFSTVEALVEGDGNERVDLYERDLAGGETKRVSTPGTCPVVSEPEEHELDCTPVYAALSNDGSHVFFETNERISGEDTDSKQDVYDWSGGTAALASTGAEGEEGAGLHDARYAGNSAAGGKVFFLTDEQLAAGDTDSGQDVYVRSGGSTELVSAGDGSCEAIPGFCDKPASLAWVSPAGSTAILRTAEPLTAEDEDASFDVYARALPGGPTTLVSRPGPSCAPDPGCGNGADDANFAGASANGSDLFFVTAEALSPPDPGEPLVPGDADARTDVYDRSGSTTTLVSAGSINGNGPYDAQLPLQGVSANGARAFFVTRERLTDEDDFAGEEDIYSRAAGVTLLVSRSNDGELESLLAPPPPELERTDPEWPDVSTEPKLIGSEPEAAASIKIYTTPDCSGEPVATGGAEELAEPGIAVSVASGSTTSFRATAEAEGFVSACSGTALVYKQEDPVPPGEESGGGGGAGGGGESTLAPAPEPASAPPKTHDGIAYLTPATRITFGPAFKTRARHPAFRFTDSTGQPGTRFICRVDRRRWKGCDSPTRMKRLGRGRHVFRVKAVNAIGVWEARPSRRAFKLVRGAGKHRKHVRHSKRARR